MGARGLRQLLGRDAALALAIVASVFVLQLPFCLHGVNLLDEGAILEIADELLRGRRLYADVQYPAFPGVLLVTAALFRLFGSSFATARIFAAGVFAGTVGVMFLMARWLLPRRAAVAVALLCLVYRVWAYPHWHMVSYSSLGVALVLAAGWVVGDAFEHRGHWRYALAGLVAGAAVLAKQDIGPVGVGVLGFAVLTAAPIRFTSRMRAALVFGAAACVLPGIMAAWALATGIMPDLVQHTLVAPQYGFRHFDYQGRPPLFPLLRQDATIRRGTYSYFPPILLDLYAADIGQSALFKKTPLVDVTLKLVYYLPWFVFVVAFLPWLERRWRQPAVADLRDARETLLVFLGAGFLLAFNRPHDWIHLLVLYPSTLLLGALTVSRALAHAGRWRRALAGAGAVLFAIGVGLAVVLAVAFRRHHGTPVETARGRLYASAPQASALQSLVDGVAAAAPPDAPLAPLPYHPLASYVTGRPLGIPYIVVWPVDPDPSREQRIIDSLERVPETVVVYSPTQVPHFAPLAEYAPALFRYLVEHFEIARTFGGDPAGYTFLLLRRRSPSAEARSLLGAALAAARVTVEPPNGPAREVRNGERAQFAREALWPFVPVLSVTTMPDTTVAVTYRLRPSAGERLVLAYGVNPDHWLDLPPPRARFSVAVRAAGTEREVLAAETDPVFNPAHRRWTEAVVDLSPWAGQPIEVVLRVAGPPGMPTRAGMFGWGIHA